MQKPNKNEISRHGSYDLIVIGAGPGGYPAALLAAGLSKRVAVVERRELGGTCLNRGCIPTKTLLHTTGLFRELRGAKEAGLHAEALTLDQEKLRDRVRKVTESLRNGITAQLKQGGIDVYTGTGTIEAARQVSVRQGEETIRLESEYILIATGSRPAKLPIPGIDSEGVTDSDGLLEAADISLKRLIIIGGGVIGMEFAQMYSDIGCSVTVLEAMDRILPGMDKEIAQNLKMIGKKRGVEIHTGAMVKEIKRLEDGLVCRFEEKGAVGEAKGDRVLIAAGRCPNTEGLFSKAFDGSAMMTKGCLRVDHRFRTEIPGVYAIGDVIGGVRLAHAATAEGISAVEDMWDIEHRYDMKVVPSCVYTDPEIAVVGMTLDEAREAGIPAAVGKHIMSLNGKSLLTSQERGFIKLVEREDTHVLIGAQLMCARATDMIGELELAIKQGMSARQVAEIIMPHPTFCEGIGEAADKMGGLHSPLPLG